MEQGEQLDAELERRILMVGGEGYAGEALSRAQYNWLWFLGIVIPVILFVLVLILF